MSEKIKVSKTQLILKHLKRGAGITPMQAWEKYGVYRLSSVIHSLRKRGFKIQTEIRAYNGSDYAYYIMRRN